MNKIKTIRKKYSNLKDGDNYIHNGVVKIVGNEISKPKYVCEVVKYITTEFPRLMRIPLKSSDGFLVKTIVHKDNTHGFLSTEGQFYPQAL